MKHHQAFGKLEGNLLLDLVVDLLVNRVAELFKLHLDVLKLISGVILYLSRRLVHSNADLFDKLLDFPEALLALPLNHFDFPFDGVFDHLLVVRTEWCLVFDNVSEPLWLAIVCV